MKNKCIIISHANCNDGLCGATIGYEKLSTEDKDVTVDFLNHGEEVEYLNNNVFTDNDTVYFIDFSFNRELTVKLAGMVKEVIVIDHHASALDNLIGLDSELDNLTLFMRMENSGCALAHEYFGSSIPKDVVNYIEDRDIWNKVLPNTDEINAGISTLLKNNDMKSMYKLLYSGVDEALEIGKYILAPQKKLVTNKLTKLMDVVVNNVPMKAVNATEYISEIGNAICLEYGVPALMYFITNEGEVVCSLRSTDDLPSVKDIAVTFGGGGHRNACGMKITLEELTKLLTLRTINADDIKK